MPRYVDPGHIPGAVFIPNCASVRLIWSLPNGKTANNVLHASYTSPPLRTQAYVNTLYTAITTATATTTHRSSLSPLCALQAVAVRDMAQTDPPGGWTETRSNLGAVNGTGTGDPLPPNVSYVVSLKTDRRGQASRGRVYLTGFTEAQNTPGGDCLNTTGDACVAFIGAVQTAMAGSGLTLAIAHPARNAYDSPTPPFTHHDARGAGTVVVNSILKLNDHWDSTRLRQLH